MDCMKRKLLFLNTFEFESFRQIHSLMIRSHPSILKISIIGFLVLNILLFNGCQNNKPSAGSSSKKGKNDSTGYNGVYKSYRDGYLYSEVTLEEGKKNGLAKRFYKNGKVNTEVYYKNNIKVDTSRWYYTNGKIYRETPYNKGKIHGIQKKYHKNGVLKAEIPYVNGNREVGLKEYSYYNSPIKSYPSIIYYIDDQRKEKGQVFLTIRLSNNSEKVKFYQGELEKGIFDTDKAIYILTEKGRGTISFVEKADYTGKNQINIIAYHKTKLGNYKILQKKITLPSTHLKE